MKKLITIIIPCYNEQDALPLCLVALRELMSDERYDWHVMLVDDGSDDNTLNVMREERKKDNRVSYIELSRNFGKETAMLAGMDEAEGDCVILMDADLQHPVNVIPQLIQCWEEGYDDIYAYRAYRGKETLLRKVMTKLFYRLLRSNSREKVYPNAGDFRLLDKKCVEALKSMREANRYTKGLYSYIGFRKTYVSFHTQDRVAGESKMLYNKLIKLAIDGLLSSSIRPLRLATYLGVGVSACSFIYMLFVLIKTLIYGDAVQGFPTLVILLLFLGGVQLLSLGIIGEYVGRTFEQTKQRPNYFIRSKNGD